MNSLIGADAADWRTGIPTFSAIRYVRPWAGVSVDFHGDQSGLEYDFRIAAGADPSRIHLGFSGAHALRLSRTGALILALPGGDIRQRPPRAYQVIGGQRQPVPSRFSLLGGARVGIAVGAYDRSRPLIVDPTIAYSSYLGGAGSDVGRAIAVDGSGAAYVAGQTTSTDYPTASPEQAANAGGTGSDAFVSKLNPAGTALVYSTYIGGTADDAAYGVAVDSSGAAYLTGLTSSTNFPTQNAVQPANGGGRDIFVSKLSPTGGALAYSSYIGGGGNDTGVGIAVDSTGAAYIDGSTDSLSFPTTNPFQGAFHGATDGVVFKLSPDGASKIYSTYLGGSDNDAPGGIAVDSSGAAYVMGGTFSTDFPTMNPLQAANAGGGGDAFVTKLTPAGNALAYSTYLGGTGVEFFVGGLVGGVSGGGIAVDSAGSAYVSSATSSVDFPTKDALQPAYAGGVDAFVTKLNPAGSALGYSTYLGGSGADLGFGLGLDDSRAAYVTGMTQSSNFPTQSASQVSIGGGTDAFASKLDPAGSALAYSSYLGGSGGEYGYGIAVDGADGAYLTGQTASADFPTQSAAQGANGGGTLDAFVAKISGDAVVTPPVVPPVTPPPPANPPPNHFKIGKAKVDKKKGTAKLTVGVPGPGSLSLKGKGLKKAKTTAKAAGSVKLPVKPSGATTRKLKRNGKAKIKAKVTFTPTGGRSNTESTSIKLVKKK